MKVTVKTEKEIIEENLFPAGTYSFEIKNAADKVSKANNEMIELTVAVYNNDGKMRLVNDYLLDSMAFKLRHCADACGIIDRYESGMLLASDFVGRTGELKLKITKDRNGQYPDRNDVADYVKKADQQGLTVGDDEPNPWER